MPEQDAHAQGEKQAENGEGTGQPMMWPLGVSLGEHFVEDLGNPVIERVAETGQEVVPGAGSGWTGTWPRLAAFTGRPEARMIVDSRAGGRHQVRSFRVQCSAQKWPGPGGG